jgi:mono/diheme cytochrome c family protein
MRTSIRLPSRRAANAGSLLRVLAVAAGLAWVSAWVSVAGAADATKSSALWSAHIQPLFSQHCFKCHGEVKQKGELDLTTLPAMLKGGDSGPAIVPGDPTTSLVYKFVQPGAEQHMPPKDYQLSEDEIALLKMWIASLPKTGTASANSTNSAPEWNASNYQLVRPNTPKVLPPKRATPSEAIDFYLDRERQRLAQTAAANKSDKVRVKLARTADDRAFVRRLYLDVLGRIPTTAEAEAFLRSREKNKRAALTDRLLASPEHARHLREVFDVVLMGKRSRNDSWNGYLEWAFQTNRPWDRIVRDVLLARPETKAERGAVRFLFDRKDNHQAIVEAVSPALLGLQIQCAQCHNHPLAPEIKQKHYWGMVAFFNRGKNMDTPEGPAISESAIGGFVKFANLKKESQDAVLAFFNDAVVPETRPGDNEKEADTPEKYKLALEDGKKAGLGAVPKFSRREEFANLATRDNPLLARAFVNRAWAMLMGRGLVHPVDRMDSAHPPTHPDLLAWLARDFEQSSYDIRRLLRNILLTRAYQLDSTPADKGPKPAPETFAYALEKPLSAESLWRSTLVATGHTPDANGNFPQHDKTRAKFVDAFPELFPVEFNANLKQALFLTNNPLLDELLRPKDGNLTEKLLALATPRDRVQAAFAAILGRAPDTEELTRATAYLTTRAKNPEVATRELVWSLLTGAEFRFNH